MSIDRQYGEVVFTCDECGDSYETGERDFYKALRMAKEEGWLITRDDDDQDWIHICDPCCKEKPHAKVST